MNKEEIQLRAREKAIQIALNEKVVGLIMTPENAYCLCPLETSGMTAQEIFDLYRQYFQMLKYAINDLEASTDVAFQKLGCEPGDFVKAVASHAL